MPNNPHWCYQITYRIATTVIINIVEMGRKINQLLWESRIRICKNCPIYSPNNEGICSNSLYLNPQTGEVSTNPLDGYIKGCGCKIKLKAKLETEKCPAGKWEVL